MVEWLVEFMVVFIDSGFEKTLGFNFIIYVAI